MWTSLKKRLEFSVPPGHVTIPVTQADIDSFQARHGIPLPHSYCCFLKEIGYGTLRNYFNIAAPLRGRRMRGLDALMRAEQGNETLASIYGDEAFVARMISFSDTIAGDIIVWDPLQRSGKTRIEYEVFVLPRDRSQIMPIANDFREYVRGGIYGRRFEEAVCGWIDPEWPLEYTFQPHSKRLRK